MKHLLLILLGGFLVIAAQSLIEAQTTPPKIEPQLAVVNSKVSRGKRLRGVLVFEVPKGYHVNAHNPVSKFAIATKIELDVSGETKVGSIAYPKALVRRFGFAEEPLGVYENRVVIRFVLDVPPDERQGDHELKVRLRYQSCSDQVCFPPADREVTTSFTVF